MLTVKIVNSLFVANPERVLLTLRINESSAKADRENDRSGVSAAAS